MKVIIINDIKGDKESIIPYGLNLAKHLEQEAIILHVIDPRVQQAVPSVVADSSTVSADEKLSNRELMAKELRQSKQELDSYLSAEISRLNYPLKWEMDISFGSIQSKVAELAEEFPDAVFVLNKQPDHYIFESQKESIDISKTFEGMCLFVPSGAKFVPYKSLLAPCGFAEDELDAFTAVHEFIYPFESVFNLLGRTKEERKNENELMLHVDQLFPKATVNYREIKDDNFEDEFVDFADMIEPDLLVIFEEQQGFWKSLVKKELVRKVLETTKSPVLYFSGKSDNKK